MKPKQEPTIMQEQPKQPSTTSTSQQPSTTPKAPREKKPMGRKLYTALIIPACVIAGVAGSFAYSQLISSTTEQQAVSNSTVISQEGDAIAEAASKIGPSVVSIVTESTSRTLYGGSTQEESAGSGIIISKDGYVMTNKHVVSSSTGSVQVILADGTSYDNVEFVGSDPSNDVSFLKIKGVSDLTPATLGDSSTMKVGTKVIAVGNALGEYQNTVTTGIISALGRPVVASDSSGSSTEQLENLIQTDAAINSGNSGGPLVSLSGEVIGINTAVASNAQGIGFAIPVNDVKGMVKTLLSSGKVVKPYIGVRYVSITADIAKEYNLPVKSGAYIISGSGEAAVVSGSPADQAGLKEKDIITKINGTAVDGTHPFASLIAQHSVGEQVTITYLRDGKESTVTVTLAERSS